ncbi:MAG: DcaP family trimeric outer membrane transporter [Pseudomonadota bacterium]
MNRLQPLIWTDPNRTDPIRNERIRNERIRTDVIQSQSTRWRKPLLMLGVFAWSMLTAVSPALAQDDRMQAMEARIAELEAMIEQLVEGQQQMQQVAAAPAAGASPAPVAAQPAAEVEDNKPEFYWGGYIKVDTILSDFEDGVVSGDSIGRDFFVASTIPVGGEGEGYVLDIHARQSRFFVGANHSFDENNELAAYLEFDFLATPGGNERVSNSYVPRMRHAFLRWNDWLVGQTWSTFMDVSTLPESVDFIGPAGSTSFIRQPQIRYSRNGFSIALENPETTVTPNGGGARIDTDDGVVPDLAMNYRFSDDWGHVQVGGLLRQLAFEDQGLGVDDTQYGWGLSLSGKFMLGRDDLRWMVHHGDGMGRYVGLNFSNGAVIDNNNQLEAIGTTGGFVAYRHLWSEKWRSNAVISYLEVDNPVQFTGLNVSESNWSGQINLMYSPVKPLTFGIEYLLAERDLETGQSGRLNRFQFTGKYAF